MYKKPRFCKKCHQVISSDNHKCFEFKIRYHFEIPDNYNSSHEETELFACDYSNAADLFAEWYDQDGNPLLQSPTPLKIVVIDENGNGKIFEVNAEAEVAYYSREL